MSAMGVVVLRPPPQVWTCAFCGLEDPGPAVGNLRPGDGVARMHPCPAQGGLVTPLRPPGQPSEVRRVEREDYLAGDDAQTDAAGRPVMAWVTVRDDGMDCAVLAPCARLTRDEVHGWQ